MTKYYAVRKGRKIGIFTDWLACKDLISGFAGAEYKSFLTEEEANEYINTKFECFPNTDDSKIDTKIYDPFYNKIINDTKHHKIPNLKKYVMPKNTIIDEEELFIYPIINKKEEEVKIVNSYKALPSFIYNINIKKNDIKEDNIKEDNIKEDNIKTYKLPNFITDKSDSEKLYKDIIIGKNNNSEYKLPNFINEDNSIIKYGKENKIIDNKKSSYDLPYFIKSKCSIKEDSIKEDNIKEDSIKEDSIKEDSIKEDSIKEDSIKEDSIKEDSINGYKLPNFIHKMDKILYKLPNFINELESDFDEYGSTCIYVDGGCNKQTKDTAFASVVDYQGNDLIEKYSYLFPDMDLNEVILPVGKRVIAIAKFDDVKKQQNNGAELLALIIGYRIALEDINIRIIYSDSDLMIKYWSKKLDSIKASKMDQRKVKYIYELINLRMEYESKGNYNSLRKISGDKNLADLGYH
jgi:pentapeptide MXKDX repeat protein